MKRMATVLLMMTMAGCSPGPYARLEPGNEGSIVLAPGLKDWQNVERGLVVGRGPDPESTPTGARLIPIGSVARVTRDDEAYPEDDRARRIEVVILDGVKNGFPVVVRRDQFRPR